MIVTIDGPAGTGKSTVAKQLAAALGFEYLDTGAMYRMIAVLAVEEDADLESAVVVADIAKQAELNFQDGAAILNGKDVSSKLREPEVAVAASVVAQNHKVREKLVDRQRELAAERDIVCEGRDQGTVVFPQAEAKFFLTATSEVRAKRRLQELLDQGKEVLFEQLLEEQNERDKRDENRPVAPLKPADDAVLVDSTELTIADVVSQLEKIVHQRRTH